MEDIAHGSADTAGDESQSMEFLLSDELSLDLPRAGDIRRGEVIEHLRNAILVDIGAKSEGIIAGSELDALSPEERDELAVGNEVAVYVVDPEDEDGNIVLSYTRAAEEEDWRLAQELADTSDVYQGKVVGYNKGGLLVAVGRLRGFMPISQLGPSRNFSREKAPAMQLQRIVGETISAKVMEVDRSRNRLILSERAATREKRAAQRERLFDELETGEVRSGRVVNLTDF